ncbi:MAG: LacI family transcriptional regulator [Verrucomicrobia bacterium Tous-C9LFEB]|nr:MAG: LacI family transcriptional regulator [Verrucomicrobia bacterium Tous-C9LFEB]
MPKRPTQRDIAQQAGTTQATVSLALSNHPRISTQQRKQIQQIARQMGYEIDPYLSGLSAYRRKLRPPQFHGVLAWISNDVCGESWKDITTFQHYFRGASVQAAELGYRIEEHFLRAPGMTPERVIQILRHRGVSGILFAPQPQSELRLKIDLRHFSAVTFGYSLVEPRLHMASSHHFRITEILMQKILALGYKRPGLAFDEERDRRTAHLFSAAFMSEQRRLPSRNRIPILMKANLEKDLFLSWFQKEKPDVIITLWEVVHPWLKEERIRVPQDVGLALLSVRYRKENYSGIWERPDITGKRAVEYLVDLIHRGERGVPSIPSYLLIEGEWITGKTVRAQR